MRNICEEIKDRMESFIANPWERKEISFIFVKSPRWTMGGGWLSDDIVLVYKSWDFKERRRSLRDDLFSNLARISQTMEQDIIYDEYQR